VPVILIIIAVAVLVPLAVWVVKKRKGKKHKSAARKSILPFSPFQQKMTSAGFTAPEAALLYEIVASASPENSTAFLTSHKSLDAVIITAMQRIAATGQNNDPDAQEFVGKLLDRRKRITIQKMNARQILSGSREIPAGQSVQVVLTGVGIITTQVVPHSSYFSILSPIVRDLPVDFKWRGRNVMIFFRKRNEGEYSFNTTIVEEIEDKRTGDFILLMDHEAPLFHTQNRSSVRAALKKQAHIYPIGDGIGRTFTEGKPCALSDISDDGCSVVMEGKVNMPRSVIVQLTLGGQFISMNGECLRVQYNRIKNTSRLHIKTESIPRRIKNIILSVTFGIIKEENDPVILSGTREEGEPRQTSEPLPDETGSETGEPAAPPSP
jgi:c-di-GMP-binding flagellar brake protein YcgR